MLLKYATLKVLAARMGEIPPTAGDAFRRTAVRWNPEYEPRPGFLYVRSRAISSRTNDNFDTFPAAEIAKAYRTFVGKPVFVNHHNADHRRARGVIIDAVLHEDFAPDGSPDTWVEVLMEIDAISFPKLAEAILKGRIDRTSMGTSVGVSECSYCGNRATTMAEFCKHIPAMKGQRITRLNPETGKRESVLVSEICYDLTFFENSLLVEDPADPTAVAWIDSTAGLEGHEALAGLLSTASRTAQDKPTNPWPELEATALGPMAWPMGALPRTDWQINGQPYWDGVWIEVQPDVWYRGNAVGEIASELVVRRREDGKWVWEGRVAATIGAPHENKPTRGMGHTLEQAQERAEKSLARDHEFHRRYVERQMEMLKRTPGSGFYEGHRTAAKVSPGDLEFVVEESYDDEAHFYVYAHLDGEEVGVLVWYASDGEIGWVHVEEPHRRKGIATAMLAHAREVDPRVHHSDFRSADGRAWSQKAASLPAGITLVYSDFDAALPRIRAEDPEGRMIGTLSWWSSTGEVFSVQVEPQYRRQGVATAMWQEAKAREPRLHHSTDLSPDGLAWSQKVARRYDHETDRFLLDQVRGIAKDLTWDEATAMTRMVLTDAGFPLGGQAEAVPHPRPDAVHGSVGWQWNDIWTEATPLVALSEHSVNEFTLLHECAHIIRNGPEMAGRGPQGTDFEVDGAHDQRWWDSFTRLIGMYASPLLANAFRTLILHPVEPERRERYAALERTAYQGGHRAPSGEDDVAAPLHDVETMMPDYYTRPNLYSHDRGPVDRECEQVILGARGKPDQMVTVFRALPPGYTTINTGDWVTISLAYAQGHAAQYEGEDWPIISARVPASTLWTEGYAAEWGYSGPPVNARTATLHVEASPAVDVVDFKADRPLSGADARRLDSIIPGSRTVAYNDMPFLEDMEALGGLGKITDPRAYGKARDALFETVAPRRVGFHGLVLTQDNVNMNRVQQIVDDPSTGGSKPLHMVSYRGETYVINGHHRLAADYVRGESGIEARVLDMDGHERTASLGYYFTEHRAMESLGRDHDLLQPQPAGVLEALAQEVLDANGIDLKVDLDLIDGDWSETLPPDWERGTVAIAISRQPQNRTKWTALHEVSHVLAYDRGTPDFDNEDHGEEFRGIFYGEVLPRYGVNLSTASLSATAAMIPDLPEWAIEGQFAQYPQTGSPGITYFRGDIPVEDPPGTRWYVDCLLAYDEDGYLAGVLNHYPMDMGPERKGNVNILVRPSHRRQGIGSALWREAVRRWGVVPAGQDTTDSGAALLRAVGSHHTASSLTLTDYISVAEEAVERSHPGAGKRWRLPSKADFPKAYENDGFWAAMKPVTDFVHEVLRRAGKPVHEWFRVDSDGWHVTQMGAQGATDGLNWIDLRNPATTLTILHECAHVIRGTGEGAGHDRAFVETLASLLDAWVSPAAAEQFTHLVGFHDEMKRQAYAGWAEAEDPAAPVTLEVAWRRDYDGDPLPEGQGMVVARKGTAVVGALRWSYYDDPPVVVDVSVHPDHRRQGIATQMLAKAREVESRLVHSEVLTDDGKAWMQAVGSMLDWQSPTSGWKRSPGGNNYRTSIVGKNGLTYYIAGTYDKIEAFTEKTWGTGGEIMKVPVGTLVAWEWNGRREIYQVGVNKEHRRQGVASAMLALAREFYPDLVHAGPGSLSDDGKAWAAAYASLRTAARDEAWLAGFTWEVLEDPPGIWAVGGIRGTHPDGGWGFLTWHADGEIRYVEVGEEYRRRGLASELFRRAKEIKPDLHHSTQLNEHSRPWAATVASTRTAAKVRLTEVERVMTGELMDYYRIYAKEGRRQIGMISWYIYDDALKELWVEDRPDKEAIEDMLLAAARAEEPGFNIYPWDDAGLAAAASAGPADLVWIEEERGVTVREPGGRMVAYLSWHGSTGEVTSVWVHEDYRRQGIATEMWRRGKAIEPWLDHDYDRMSNDAQEWARTLASVTKTGSLTVQKYYGKPGRGDHLTQDSVGTIATDLIKDLPGKNGEVPGEHRNMQGQEWAEFVADVRERGVQRKVFIVVEETGQAWMYEGNHRRDAAVEAGLPEVPVEIRFFGKSEDVHPFGALR